jgi:UDP-N-acetylglucosamine/UDP-N-acetylgalactosamine diphosphorylase
MKTGPFEKLGNFVTIDGRLTIIEYSDMPAALAESTEATGQLRFRAGSPAIHVLRRDFVERLTGGGLNLPLHRAVKKVPYLDARGAVVEPAEANAVKLETFIFDALPLARNPLILEAVREEQFGPVKNATGVDSVESCRALLLNRSCRWLEAAGVRVPRRPDGTPDCVVELSARRFLDLDDVIAAAPGLTPPAAGEERLYS